MIKKREHARMPGGYHCTAYREQMETSHYPATCAWRPWRFGELQKSLEGISQKVLTDSLRSMEKDGLITRTVYPEVPPRVEYALSELGESMDRSWTPCRPGRSLSGTCKKQFRQLNHRTKPLFPGMDCISERKKHRSGKVLRKRLFSTFLCFCFA